MSLKVDWLVLSSLQSVKCLLSSVYCRTMTPNKHVRSALVVVIVVLQVVSCNDTFNRKQSPSPSRLPPKKHPVVDKTSLFPSHPPASTSLHPPSDDTLSSPDVESTMDHFDLDADEYEEETHHVSNARIRKPSSSSVPSSHTSRKRYDVKLVEQMSR
jgi:hypothetical protein